MFFCLQTIFSPWTTYQDLTEKCVSRYLFHRLFQKKRGVYSLNHLSPPCFVAHKSSTDSLHLFFSAAIIRASYHEFQPASFCSFYTVRLHVVFGLPLLLLPSGVQVIPLLLWLSQSCRSICPVIFHVRHLNSALTLVSCHACFSQFLGTLSNVESCRICLRHLFWKTFTAIPLINFPRFAPI